MSTLRLEKRTLTTKTKTTKIQRRKRKKLLEEISLQRFQLAKYSFTAFVSRKYDANKSLFFGSYLFIFHSLLPQLLINRIMTTRLVQSHQGRCIWKKKRDNTYSLLSGSPLVERCLLNYKEQIRAFFREKIIRWTVWEKKIGKSFFRIP